MTEEEFIELMGHLWVSGAKEAWKRLCQNNYIIIKKEYNETTKNDCPDFLSESQF